LWIDIPLALPPSVLENLMDLATFIRTIEENGLSFLAFSSAFLPDYLKKNARQRG
jgi:hypothetical protein